LGWIAHPENRDVLPQKCQGFPSPTVIGASVCFEQANFFYLISEKQTKTDQISVRFG
jgi:hypothetical protein